VRDIGFENPASGYGDWKMRGNVATLAAWIEVFLLGPRILLAGAGYFAARRRLRSVDLTAAAATLRVLVENDGGVLMTKLRIEVDPSRLNAALHYLEFHDWVGISKNADRAWALTEARQRLR
jgi:hypothetical protein